MSEGGIEKRLTTRVKLRLDKGGMLQVELYADGPALLVVTVQEGEQATRKTADGYEIDVALVLSDKEREVLLSALKTVPR